MLSQFCNIYIYFFVHFVVVVVVVCLFLCIMLSNSLIVCVQYCLYVTSKFCIAYFLYHSCTFVCLVHI